ncbi:YccF domain-containing protein [Citricoccus sp. GCM10030269]|uniref:YccF domain-containing protein n=1 Tax=Citricoccus sp. GCM10030269 TaxID=3273388 RepID=UPI0036114560
MNRPLNLLLNIIWLVFGGLWLSLGYFLAGVACCVLIITIPFGVASFRIAGYALWPFGRTVVNSQPTMGLVTGIGNLIWFIVAGLWIAIGHVLTSIPMFLSIIGIPLGLANLRMIPVSLVPLGKRIVDSGVARSLPQYIPTSRAGAGYR